MYTVKLVGSNHESSEVHAFTSRVYARHGYIPDVESLKEVPPYALYVRRSHDQRIVGSLGMYVSSEQMLPVDYFFSNFRQPKGFEAGCHEERSIEASRFCITDSGQGIVAALLLGGIYSFMQSKHCRVMYASVKLALLHHLKYDYALPVQRLSARVNPERVPEEYRSYFLPDNPRDAPVIMRIVLDEDGTMAFARYYNVYQEYTQQKVVEFVKKYG
jgi:hypothetical protein